MLPESAPGQYRYECGNAGDVRERFKQQGVDADPGTPAQLAAHVKAESARFDRLIGAIGLKPG